ncbi:hypothetical protein HOT75_gp147 [Gordonia phage Daredevil]|uniref:Uncharacterized protein n=1 Tax=Gordonia phage Daredevil TaxID=2283286 RepID=A0A345MJ02_9CAUD|nr:hypothetical protein HOT75_gp147 [Gordonia phage Daredevil]AXH70533.1 hypothetical protein SEA_DAREDEVIL_147 [Gordonia phage Daredevil]
MTLRSFLASPFIADVKLVCVTTVACLILSIDYTPWS